MSCVPEHYVACAREILDVKQEENFLRAVISRAYYGAYHAAKCYHTELPSPGSVIDGSGTHNQLISQLRHPTVGGTERKRSIAVGNLLMAACSLRVTADYKLDQAVSLDEARDAISKAEQILAGTNVANVAAKQA